MKRAIMMLHVEMTWLIKTEINSIYEAILLFKECPLITLFVAKYFVLYLESWQCDFAGLLIKILSLYSFMIKTLKPIKLLWLSLWFDLPTKCGKTKSLPNLNIGLETLWPSTQSLGSPLLCEQVTVILKEDEKL